MCMGINGNMTYKSTIFTLQVYCKILYYNNVVIIDVVIVDPPKFEEGNNVTKLKEFLIWKNVQLIVTLSVVVTSSISTGSPTTSRTLTSSAPSPTPTAPNSKKSHGKSPLLQQLLF